MRGTGALFFGLVIGCAPAAPRPTKSTAPLPSSPAPPVVAVVPHPARWSGMPAFRSDQHPLELGADRLYVGAAGRRLVLRVDGFAEATQLAPEPLVAARAVGTGFRFYGALGAIYESEAPLSTFSTVQAGVFSFATRPEIAVGARNAVAVAEDGGLFVSVDGARFQRVDKQTFGIPAWARPRHVTMNAKGEGALLATPQRLFLTKDDGKTWHSADPPAAGLSGLATTESGTLFGPSIVRPGDMVRMDGVKLTAPPPRIEIGASPAPRLANFVDERLVLYDEARLEVVGADGVRIVTKLQKEQRMLALGGSGAQLVALGPNQVLVSDDGGGHFTESLPWAVPSISQRARVRVEGSAFVVANCESTCSAVSARATSGALHDIATTEDAAVLDVALAGGTVYLLGFVGGRVRLYAGPPSASKLPRIGNLDLPLLSSPSGLALSADAAGVRALVGLSSETVLLQVDVAGVARPPVVLPHVFGAAALVGQRGLATVTVEPTHHLVETMDGGEHWTPVGGPATGRSIECTSFGCTLDDLARFGWDLPAPAEGPREESATPQVKASTLSCALVGTARKLSEEASVHPQVDGNGLRVVVLTPDAAQGQTLEVVGQKALPLAPKAKLGPTKALLGPAAYDADLQGHVVVTKVGAVSGGVLAMRSHVPTAGMRKPESLGPVGVELFWWSRATGKLRAADLGTLAPFRVAITSPSLDGEAVVLADDSLLFHPTGAPAAWRVGVDGKSRMLAFPSSVSLEAAVHGPSLLRFSGHTSAGAVVGLFDAQGLVHTFGWNFGDASVALTAIGATPYLTSPQALFSLEELSANVPEPVLRGPIAPSCSGALGPVVEETSRGTILVVDGQPTAKLRVRHASVSVDAKGHSCLVARSFYGTQWKDHSQAWVGGGGGWLLRDGNLQALACKP